MGARKGIKNGVMPRRFLPWSLYLKVYTDLIVYKIQRNSMIRAVETGCVTQCMT